MKEFFYFTMYNPIHDCIVLDDDELAEYFTEIGPDWRAWLSLANGYLQRYCDNKLSYIPMDTRQRIVAAIREKYIKFFGNLTKNA